MFNYYYTLKNLNIKSLTLPSWHAACFLCGYFPDLSHFKRFHFSHLSTLRIVIFILSNLLLGFPIQIIIFVVMLVPHMTNSHSELGLPVVYCLGKR